MKFKIVHDTPGRIRLRCGGYYFDKNQEKVKKFLDNFTLVRGKLKEMEEKGIITVEGKGRNTKYSIK